MLTSTSGYAVCAGRKPEALQKCDPLPQVHVCRVGTGRKAFTLVELLVTITTIAILLSLLLVGVERSRERSRRTVCLSNQKQLALALLLYAHDDPGGRFWRGESASYPVMDANWLQQVEKLAVSVFFCPSTRNGLSVVTSRYPDGSLYYPALNMVGMDRDSNSAYSYDILAWFADMENYWNGNSESWKNSRFVPKTTSNIGTYAHKHEAFSLKGKSAGPSAVWLLTDNNVISLDPFWPGPKTNHGPAGANTAFADGHVEWIKQREYLFRYELSQDNNRTRPHPRVWP